MAEDKILKYVDDDGEEYEVLESKRDDFLKVAREEGIHVTQPVTNPRPLGTSVPSSSAPSFADTMAKKYPMADIQYERINEPSNYVEQASADTGTTRVTMPSLQTREVDKAQERAQRAIDDSKPKETYVGVGPLMAYDEYQAYDEQGQYNNYLNSEFSSEDRKTHDYVRDMLIANSIDGTRSPADGITEEQYEIYKRVEQADADFFNSPLAKRVRQRNIDSIDKERRDVGSIMYALRNEDGAYLTSLGYRFDDKDKQKEYDTYLQASDLLDKAKKRWSAGSRYDDRFANSVRQYVKAHGDKISDIDYWGAIGGMADMRRNKHIRDIGEKMEAAAKEGKDPVEVLTDAEARLLEAYYVNANANAMRARDISKGYLAGEVAADAIPFMVDFILTDGAATGVKNAVAKALGNKFLGKSIGGFAGAMARTPLMPTSYSNASRQLLERNEDGSFKYGTGKSWAVGMLDSAIETLSESFGAGLEKYGLGKLIGNKLATSKVGSAAYDILHSTNDVLRMGGFNGLAGEWTEELYGTLLRMGLPGLYGERSQQWSDFWDADNQGVMLGGFAVMAGLGAVGNVRGRIATERQYKDELSHIRAAQSRYSHGLRSALSGLGISEKDVDSFVKGVEGKSVQQLGEQLDNLLNLAPNTYDGNYADFVKLKREAKRNYGGLLYSITEQGHLDEAYKEKIAQSRGELKPEDMLFDWDAIEARRQQRRAEKRQAQAEEAVAAQEEASQAPATEPQMPQPLQATATPEPAQAAEPQTDREMFAARNKYASGKPVSIDNNGVVTPVTKKDGDKDVPFGYLIDRFGKTLVVAVETNEEDANGNAIWHNVSVSERVGYNVGEPVEADAAYSSLMAPVKKAQEDAAALHDGAVDTETENTQNTIDVAQQQLTGEAPGAEQSETPKEEPEAPKEEPTPEPGPEPEPAPVPVNDDEAFLASLPKKGKTNNLDYSAFTPEQTVRYAAMQSDEATAMKIAEGTVAKMKKRLADIGDVSSLTFDEDGLAKISEAKKLTDDIAQYEAIIDDYRQGNGIEAVPETAPVEAAPAEQPVAAAPAEAPVAAEEPAAEPEVPQAAPVEAPKAEAQEAPKAEPVAAAPVEKTERPKKESKPKAKKETEEAQAVSPIDNAINDMQKEYYGGNVRSQKRSEARARMAVKEIASVDELNDEKQRVAQQAQAMTEAGMMDDSTKRAIDAITGIIDARIAELSPEVKEGAAAAQPEVAEAKEEAPAAQPEVVEAKEEVPEAPKAEAQEPVRESAISRVTSSKTKRPALDDIDGLINYYIGKIHGEKGTAPLTKARSYAGRFGNSLGKDYDKAVTAMVGRIDEMLKNGEGNAEDLNMLRSSIEQSIDKRRNAPHLADRRRLSTESGALEAETKAANDARELSAKVAKNGIKDDDEYRKVFEARTLLSEYIEKAKAKYGLTKAQNKDIEERYGSSLLSASMALKDYTKRTGKKHADIVKKNDVAIPKELTDAIDKLRPEVEEKKERMAQLGKMRREAEKRLEKAPAFGAERDAAQAAYNEAASAAYEAAKEYGKSATELDRLEAMAKAISVRQEKGSIFGERASKKEVNRMANALIKILPEEARAGVEMLSAEDFDKVVDKIYGEGSAARLQSTGKTATGLTYTDENGKLHVYVNADAAYNTTVPHEFVHAIFTTAKEMKHYAVSDAIIEYGKKAPEEFKEYVREKYELEEGSDEFYQEVAAHAIAQAYVNKNAEFTKQGVFQKMLQAIRDFWDRLTGKASNDVWDAFNYIDKSNATSEDYLNAILNGLMSSQELHNIITYDITQNAVEDRNGEKVSRLGEDNLENYKKYHRLIDNLTSATSDAEINKARRELTKFRRRMRREMANAIGRELKGTGVKFVIKDTDGIYNGDGEYSFEIKVPITSKEDRDVAREKILSAAAAFSQDAVIEGRPVSMENNLDTILGDADIVPSYAIRPTMGDAESLRDLYPKEYLGSDGKLEVSDGKLVFLWFGDEKGFKEFTQKIKKHYGIEDTNDDAGVHADVSRFIPESGFYQSNYWSAVRDNAGNVVGYETGEGDNRQYIDTKRGNVPVRESSRQEGRVSQPRFQIIGAKGARAIDEFNGNNALAASLREANRMWRDGASERQILAKTGWQLGEDGVPRYELQDVVFSDAMNNFVDGLSLADEGDGVFWGYGEYFLPFKKHAREPLPKERQKTTIGKVIGDTEESRILFAAYPELKNIPVWLYAEDGGSLGGTLFRDDDSVERIELNLTKGSSGSLMGQTLRDAESLRGTLLHEIQHVIQRIEGFTRGTNDIKVIKQYPELTKEYNELEKEHNTLKPLLDRFNELDDKHETEVLTPEETKEYLELKDKLDAFDRKTQVFLDKCFDYYRRTYGEVEARNVQERMGMTPEERRHSLFEDTYDEDARKGILIPADRIAVDESSMELSAVKKANNVLSKYDKALLALNSLNNINEMTAKEWRDFFKTIRLGDKDLQYFLGESGFRDDSDTVTKDEIVEYIESRRDNDDPMAKALTDALSSDDTRSGMALSGVNKLWGYLKDDIVAYNTLLRNLAEAGIRVAEGDNFEFRHNTQASAAGYEIEQRKKELVEPMQRAMADLAKKLGLREADAYAEVGDFLMAMHAAERNKELTCRKIADAVNEWAGSEVVTTDDIKPFYDGTKTNGLNAAIEDKINDIIAKQYPNENSRVMSGMTDSEANDYINYFVRKLMDADALNEMSELRKAIKAINDYSLNLAKEKGLISEDEYNTYTTTYENYVPLVDWENEADKEANESYSNAGGWRGVNPAIRRQAKGRRSRATNPMDVIEGRMVNTIINAYENDSRMALHRMMMAAPSAKDIFYIEGQEKPQWAKDMTDKELQEHSILVFVNGKPTRMYIDGEAGKSLSYGLDRYVTLSQMLKNNELLGSAYRAIGAANAIRSQLLTTFSPAFAVKNVWRDVSFAVRQMAVEYGWDAARDFVKNYKRSAREVWGYLMNPESVSPELKAFMENGGRIGYANQNSIEDIRRRNLTTMKRLVEGKSADSKYGKYVQGIEDVAQTLESISRYSAFLTAKDMGFDDKHAAYVAHQAATNLARHGTQQVIGRNKMFFNATLEGANQLVRNLTGRGSEYAKEGIARRQLAVTSASVAVHLMFAEMAKLGAQALISAFGGDDDDKKKLTGRLMRRVADYVRQGHLLIPISAPDKVGRFMSIRLPEAFQYRVNHYVAEQILKYCNDEINSRELYTSIWDAYMQEYNPFSGTAPGEHHSDEGWRISPAQLSPDALKPFAEAIANTTAFGGKMYNTPEAGKAENKIAPWAQAKPGTDKSAIELSKAITALTGGSPRAETKGAVNIPPEAIEHIFKSYTGFLGDVVSFADNKIFMPKTEFEQHGAKMPIIGDFTYDGRRDMLYSLLDNWKNESIDAKGRIGYATYMEFANLVEGNGGVTLEDRMDMLKDLPKMNDGKTIFGILKANQKDYSEYKKQIKRSNAK